jgi:hypothetical protein
MKTLAMVTSICGSSSRDLVALEASSEVARPAEV